MGLIQTLKDNLTILFPDTPTALRGALLRQKGKKHWHVGEMGTFVSIPEDYCDGEIYATQLSAQVISAEAGQLIVQAGEHQYVCLNDGQCQQGFGLLIH